MNKKDIAKRLSEKGVGLSVNGCGCCESPWVTLIVDGETLVDDEDMFIFDNTDDVRNRDGDP